MSFRPMRTLSFIFLLMALLLLAAAAWASLAAHAPVVQSIGELLAGLGVTSAVLDNPDFGGPAKLAAETIRAAQDLPAFLPPLILSLAIWLMGRRRRHLLHEQHRRRGPESTIVASGTAAGTLPADTSPTPEAPPRRSGIRAIVPLTFETSDPEFLPAALEILVTPPSPVAMRLMALISVTVLSSLAWSYFGRLDIYTVAPGKIQPIGRSKVIQPLEPGKVAVIKVENGDRVAAGDVLLELDHTEVAAEREAQALDLESAGAEAARRKAAVESAVSGSFTPRPIEFTDEIGQGVRLRETEVLGADLAEFRSNLDNLKAQIAEKEASKYRLRSSIEARGRLIALYREHRDMRQKLIPTGAASRAQTIEAEQQLETQITTDVGERGQLVETDAAIVSLRRKLELTAAQFIAQQTQKLVEAERKRDHLRQDLIKAKSKSDRTLLRSPLAGTVQQLAVTTVGQVVSSGQPLMTIVPLDGLIEVEATVANKDIGFVKRKQQAVVKIEAFPFTRYGVIDAAVVKVSRDAIDDREANSLTDAATAARPQLGSNSSSSRTQTLVFPVTLTMARSSIFVEGEEIALKPGMAVTVEIKTGSRRAIDYILSPLREMASQTAHER